MIITKEFLDHILSFDVLQKYRDGKREVTLADHVVSFAYTLDGLDHIAALKMLSNEMDASEKVSPAKRNKYVLLHRALRNEIDYGFHVSETVNYWFSQHTRRVGRILEINGGQAVFTGIELPLTRVEKLEEEKKEPEQIAFDI